MNETWLVRGGLGWLNILEQAVRSGVPIGPRSRDDLLGLSRRIRELMADPTLNGGGEVVVTSTPAAPAGARKLTFPPRGGAGS